MLWQKNDNVEKWGKTDKLIDDWLKERQELLILYNKLLEIHPFPEEPKERDPNLFQKFGQILTDYVSAIHFSILQKISEVSELAQVEHISIDKELIVNLFRNSLSLCSVDFEKQYETSKIKSVLSKIGEELGERLNLEDQLIKTYLQAIAHLENTQQTS